MTYIVSLLLCNLSSSNPVQSVDKTFQLTRADKDLLSKQEYDIQVDLFIESLVNHCHYN